MSLIALDRPVGIFGQDNGQHCHRATPSPGPSSGYSVCADFQEITVEQGPPPRWPVKAQLPRLALALTRRRLGVNRVGQPHRVAAPARPGNGSRTPPVLTLLPSNRKDRQESERRSRAIHDALNRFWQAHKISRLARTRQQRAPHQPHTGRL